MNKIYNCEQCRMNYKSYMGLWRHNKKHHDETTQYNKNGCKYCGKELSCRQNKWRHEYKCKLVNNQTLEEQVKKLSNDLDEIKTKQNNTITTTNSNNSNNNSNNTTNNIQLVINSPTESSIEHLSLEMQKEILDEGLNSLIRLIELINFNKSAPENHSYCVTAINDKHASVIDEKTNTIIKTSKIDLFDRILASNLNTLEKISNNPKFSYRRRNEYRDKISYLKSNMFRDNKFIKRYQNDINLLGYNNKEMIKDTWKVLKENLNDEEEEAEYYGDRPKGFDDLIAKLPEDEKPDFLKKKKYNSDDSSNSSESNNSDKKIKSPNQKYKPIIDVQSDSESESETCDYVEIKIKGITYILEGNKLFHKLGKGIKGEQYGTYSNGKLKRITHKEINL